MTNLMGSPKKVDLTYNFNQGGNVDTCVKLEKLQSELEVN
jgi:hypothetical protein